jgi:hypothetical protein
VLLPPAEHDGDLHFVARTQEPDYVALLGRVVVRVDLGPELHLLDDHVRLVAARLTCLLGVLVLELAVVHELAHRRTRGRGHLDQVEVRLLCESQCVVDPDDADCLAVGANEPDFGHPNPVIDTKLCADGSSWGGSVV